jgi:hypothetical protein
VQRKTARRGVGKGTKRKIDVESIDAPDAKRQAVAAGAEGRAATPPPPSAAPVCAAPSTAPPAGASAPAPVPGAVGAEGRAATPPPPSAAPVGAAPTTATMEEMVEKLRVTEATLAALTAAAARSSSG